MLSAGSRAGGAAPSAGADGASSLAEALGGSVDERLRHPVAGAEPAAWAQPSTVVAAALGAALAASREALEALGLDERPSRAGRSGVAFLAVAGDGDHERARRPAASASGRRATRARRGDARSSRGGGRRRRRRRCVDEPEPHWLSIERDGREPTVVALPLLPDRLATVVAQVEPDRMRLVPVPSGRRAARVSSTPDRLRRLEHLAAPAARRPPRRRGRARRGDREQARDDPFAGCLAGYVLLRLGLPRGARRARVDDHRGRADAQRRLHPAR